MIKGILISVVRSLSEYESNEPTGVYNWKCLEGSSKCKVHMSKYLYHLGVF